MKWIGTYREPTAQEAIDFGKGYIEWKAFIVKESNEIYSVSLHRVYDENQIGEDILKDGAWAKSLGAAKKIIMQDSNWKSSDFTWELIND